MRLTLDGELVAVAVRADGELHAGDRRRLTRSSDARSGIRLTGADPCGRLVGSRCCCCCSRAPAQAELVGEFNARLKDVKRSYGAYTVVAGRPRLRHVRRPDAAAGRGQRCTSRAGRRCAPRSCAQRFYCDPAPLERTARPAALPRRPLRRRAESCSTRGRTSWSRSRPTSTCSSAGPRRGARLRGRARDPERAHAGIRVPGAGGTPLQQLRGRPAVRLPARAADQRQAADPGARPAPGRDPPHDRRPGAAPPRARPLFWTKVPDCPRSRKVSFGADYAFEGAQSISRRRRVSCRRFIRRPRCSARGADPRRARLGRLPERCVSTDHSMRSPPRPLAAPSRSAPSTGSIAATGG